MEAVQSMNGTIWVFAALLIGVVVVQALLFLRLALSYNKKDAVLYALSMENDGVGRIEEPCQIFRIGEMNFPIYDERLSFALSHLMPRDREIVLLYFFEGLKDAKVAPLVHMSRATVARRRKAAMMRLRELMEDTT